MMFAPMAELEKEMAKKVNWIPVSAFEVLSIWADCCKQLASSYRELAALCGEDKKILSELLMMAEIEEARYTKLVSRVNELIDKEVAIFYANGGKVMEPQITEEEMAAIGPAIEKCLVSLKEHEHVFDNVTTGQALSRAKQERDFYNNIFAEMAALYPIKEVKQAFHQLYEG